MSILNPNMLQSFGDRILSPKSSPNSSYPNTLALLWNASDATTTAVRSRVGPDATHQRAGSGPSGLPDGSVLAANVPCVQTIDGRKVMDCGPAYSQMLQNSRFEGAVSGTPGTTPTNWIQVVAGTASGTFSAGSVSVSATAGRLCWRQSASVLANTKYILSADIICGSGLAPNEYVGGFLCPAGTVETWEVDGIVYNQYNILSAGAHTIKVTYDVSSTPGTIDFRYGVGCLNTPVTGSCVISKMQVTTNYQHPYISSGANATVSVTSRAGTTGGNGTQWPMDVTTAKGKKLLECFRGVPNGTEIWANGSASGTNWALSGSTWTHTAGSATVLAIPGVLTIGQRYLITWSMSGRTAGSVTSRAGSSGTGGSAQTTNAIFTTELTCAGSTDLQMVPSSDFAGSITVTSVQKLNPAVCALAALVRIGAGNTELPVASYDELIIGPAAEQGLFNSATSPVAAFDGTGYAVGGGVAYSRGEYQLKVMRTNSAGTQFQVGRRRYSSAMVPIDSIVVWSTLVSFDGSFNPFSNLISALNLTVPHHTAHVQTWKSSATEADILKWAHKYYPVGV